MEASKNNIWLFNGRVSFLDGGKKENGIVTGESSRDTCNLETCA